MRASLSTHLARKLGRFFPSRPHPVRWPGGVVSFTFDDFPKTALGVGGAILEAHGVRGTYYTALGLAGSDGALGPICEAEDVRAAHRRGHEIGCHTFHHVDCGRAAVSTVLAEIAENAAAMRRVAEDVALVSFAFPFGGMSLSAKRVLAGRFASCRGIGAGINAGTADFADLRANRVREAVEGDEAYRRLIDAARAGDGWAIFYTHDVAASPSPFGCTPEQFDAIVSYAAAGGTVLPVREVAARLESRT